MLYYLLNFGMPLFLVAVAALFFAKASGSVRRGLYGRAIALLIGTLLVSLIVYGSSPDDPRIPPRQPWGVVAFLPALLTALWLQKRSPRGASLSVLIAIPLALIAAGCVGSLSIFSMHVCDDHVAVSPDHRYTARFIYFDGLTYGYDMVVIKPNSILGAFRAADEIAEADCEGFENLEWRGNHTLVLHHNSATSFVRQDRHWRDVSLQYIQEKE